MIRASFRKAKSYGRPEVTTSARTKLWGENQPGRPGWVSASQGPGWALLIGSSGSLFKHLRQAGRPIYSR
jgi:hypothetical protein